MDNKPFVRDTEITLNASGSFMTGQQLADRLNLNGRTTTYGTPYKGARGTYTLIHSTYEWLYHGGFRSEADIVARVFLNQYGDHAWDK
ncbi:MAG: hypothetical protein HYZ42_18795 [Bacteroidetes bacterium]|nr:hypothetical protein [Bacteroidota bacterium]